MNLHEREAVRRPRGRPPGSKNKPKPTHHPNPNPLMSPYILEILPGNDVVLALSQFCLRNSIALSVLTASGSVSNVTLRQPSTAPITFQGRFDILSISATILPPSPSSSLPNAFTISLAAPHGQILAGAVAGPLVAAATVYLIAATFNSPSYHRLTPEPEDLRNSDQSGSAGDGQSPPKSGDGMHRCPAPSDVIWAPTARY